MNILYIIPGTGFPKEEQKNRENRLNDIAAAGTKITVTSLKEGPSSIESIEDEYSAIPPLLRLIRSKYEMYDAFIIGCAGDAGLEAAREIFKKPVVGPGEASLIFGTLGITKFGMVTTNSCRAQSKYALVRKAGFDPQNLVASLGVDVPVLKMRTDVNATVNALTEACLKAKGNHAEVVILSCMSLAFLDEGKLKEAEEKAGVPIINPIIAAVKMAEALVSIHRH